MVAGSPAGGGEGASTNQSNEEVMLAATNKPTPTPPPTLKPTPPKGCVGQSQDLSEQDCKAWQELWDETDGANWFWCYDRTDSTTNVSGGSRADPCACNDEGVDEGGVLCTIADAS